MSDNTTLSLEQRLAQRGVTRRSFLKFCALMSATLALPAVMTPKIAHALSTAATRPPLLWLEFQGCTGDSESLLRVNNPNIAQILLETLSVNYHETLMVPSGNLAIKSLNDTVAQYPGQYLVVVEGSIPTGMNGYLLRGRRAPGHRHRPRGLRPRRGHHLGRHLLVLPADRRPRLPNPTGAVGCQGRRARA